MRIDMGDVESSKYKTLPEGPHRLLISDYEETEVKNGNNKGAPMIVIELTSSEHGVSFKQWLPNIPTARWKIQQLLEAATGQQWRSNGMVVDGQVLLGRVVGALVSISSDGKYTNNRVDTYMPADELPPPGEYVNAPADFLDQGFTPEPVAAVSNLPDENFDF